MKILLAILAFAHLSSSLCYAEGPTTAELIEQLEGKHCRYKEDHSAYPPKCVPSNGLLDFISDRAPGAKDCHCRGAAASCIENQSDAKNALQALIAYLEKGPPDYDTGDGLVLCLSATISTIQAIGDPTAIDPLLSYIKNPRPVTPSAGSIKPPPLSSISSAAMTLGSFGSKAKGAGPVLQELLENPAAHSSRGVILSTLGKIGVDGGSERLAREFEKFREALRTSLVRRGNVIVDFGIERSASALLTVLQNVDDEERVQQGSADGALVLKILEMTQNELPEWTKNNIEKPVAEEGIYYRGSVEELNRLFSNIRRLAIRILARRKDPSMVSNLPELFLLGLNQKENVGIILGYGDKILPLIPVFETLAKDLKYQDKPLSETVDGMKYSRASAIIEILKGLNDPKAKIALESLRRNSSLLAKEIDRKKGSRGRYP